MKKILLISLIFGMFSVSLYSEDDYNYKLGNKVKVGSSFSYQDWCLNGEEWREYIRIYPNGVSVSLAGSLSRKMYQNSKGVVRLGVCKLKRTKSNKFNIKL